MILAHTIWALDTTSAHSSPAGTSPQAPLAGLFLWPDGQLQAFQVWKARDSGVTATMCSMPHNSIVVWETRNSRARDALLRWISARAMSAKGQKRKFSRLALDVRS